MEISAISVATPRQLGGRASRPLPAASPSILDRTPLAAHTCELHRDATTGTHQRPPYATEGHGLIRHRHGLGFCVRPELLLCLTVALPPRVDGWKLSPFQTDPNCGPRCSGGRQLHHPRPIAANSEPRPTARNWRGSPALSRADGGTCPYLSVPGCGLPMGQVRNERRILYLWATASSSAMARGKSRWLSR